MTKAKIRWAFFGSSLVSAYWNGAATYYRGLIKSLHRLGHEVTFFEPDAYDRQKNRDIDDPSWATVRVYPADWNGVQRSLEEARDADVVVKCSGVGVFDRELEQEILGLKNERNLVVFWDVDAPATLDRMDADPQDPFRSVVPRLDLILTYGGGAPVVKKYRSFGARECVPIYNALDPDTHFPVVADAKFKGALGFLGNRLPDREVRVERFFLDPARRAGDSRFILGGSGWGDKALPGNVSYVGHVFTHEHNAFNSSALAVLNLSRDSMARYGYSPATRVFEATGAAACVMTDFWEGIDDFFEPDREILVARSGEEVLEHLRGLDPQRAKQIGLAGYERVRSEHTYQHRAGLVDALVRGNKGILRQESVRWA